MLWRACKDGQLGFAVARPAGWLPGMRMLVHHAIAGAPVEQTLRGPQGVQLATRMGTANATLAASDLWPEKHYDYAWQLKRTAKYAKRIGQRLPDAEPVLRRIMAKLEDIKPSGPPRPIHGAPHLHQWLVAGDQLGLVDFDRFGLGDPELDVATFLAEADFENNFAEIGRAYHTGFAREVALNRRLLWAYRLQKHIAKALRLLSAIRLDAEDHALHVLELAAYKAERLS
jgi:aminoglycoside phosphotransferase (APT) family kinase protein